MNKLRCIGFSTYVLEVGINKKVSLFMKKKKDNGLKAVIILAVATILVGGASIAISKMEHAGSVTLDVSGANSKIKEARQNADGTYTVVISENGYVGEMIIEATYSADGQTLVSYDVTSSMETENIGTKVDEEAYKSVLSGVKLPVTASGLNISAILGIESEKASAAGALTDGVYKAQAEPDEKGNYGFVTVTVADGKVTSVVWDEMYGGASKAELAATGQYIMVEGNPTWKDQSEALGAYVVANQTTDGILNETGYTDAVSGVSIYVGGFVDLTNQAMAQASGVAVLKDGVYTAQGEPDDKGNYGFVTVTVENGKIVSAVWDEMYGGESKAQLSIDGKYVMKPVWKTQSESLGAYVVENQTTAGIMNETGYTDAVSGVSIYVGGFVGLVDKAIVQANGQDGVYTVEGEKDDKGNYGFVNVTIENGKVTNVVWDEMYGGVSKAQLSAEGKYVMKPVWKTQSESLGAYVVENQTTDGILNEKGYTDAVSGVSIYVGGFVDLTNKAIAQASENGEVPGTLATPAFDATNVDVVSGATFSSKAVLRAINEGFVYLRDFILNK